MRHKVRIIGVIATLFMLLLAACDQSSAPSGIDEPLATTATSSYTGSAAAVHMELKQNGKVICKVYNTPATTKPVVTNCPNGTYVEQLFDTNWKQIGPNKNVTVGGGTTPTSPTASGTYTGSAAAVHMELKQNGVVKCKVYNTPATTKPVVTNCPNGTYVEQLFDTNWKQIGPNKNVTVGGGTTTPPSPSGYQRIFTDNFDGLSLSGEWQTPPWPGDYRPAKFQRDQCVVSGGMLRVKATLNGDQVRSCYAYSNRTFGPNSGQLKIEYRVNVSRVQAEGGWFAAWLQTLDSEGDPYDDEPATGTEIDVMEYVPFEGDYAFARDGIDTRNSFHPAVHTGSDDPDGGIISPDTNGNGFYDANRKGINIRSGYHTFGLEWNANCQVFSVDGQPVWRNDKGVSSAQVHRLMLTMEMANAGDNGYNLWGFASGRFVDNLRTSPAEALVDWVTVDRKSTPDANLCRN